MPANTCCEEWPLPACAACGLPRLTWLATAEKQGALIQQGLYILNNLIIVHAENDRNDFSLCKYCTVVGSRNAKRSIL